MSRKTKKTTSTKAKPARLSPAQLKTLQSLKQAGAEGVPISNWARKPTRPLAVLGELGFIKTKTPAKGERRDTITAKGAKAIDQVATA